MTGKNKRSTLLFFVAPLLLGFLLVTACLRVTEDDLPDNGPEVAGAFSRETNRDAIQEPVPVSDAGNAAPSDWVASLEAVMDEAVPGLDDGLGRDFLHRLRMDLDERTALNPATGSVPLSLLSTSVRAWFRDNRQRLNNPDADTVKAHLDTLRWLIADSYIAKREDKGEPDRDQDVRFFAAVQDAVRATPDDHPLETEVQRQARDQLAGEVTDHLAREIARLRMDPLFPALRSRSLIELYSGLPNLGVWPGRFVPTKLIQNGNDPRLVREITQQILFNLVVVDMGWRAKDEMLSNFITTSEDYLRDDSVWPVWMQISPDQSDATGREFHDITRSKRS